MALVNGWRMGAMALSVLLSGASARAQGSFWNFETAPVHGADMTPDGSKLLVVNTADNRIEVFTLGGAMPVWSGSVPVGLDPVSVRARTNTEIWVTNWISDTVSVVDLASMNVIATIATGDEPADVVFAGAPQRAFVSVAGLNQVKVYDPANRAAAPQVVNIAGESPRALATDGTRVFAAIFFAGNRSTSLAPGVVSNPAGPWAGVNPPPNSGNAFNPPLNPALSPLPPTALIVNRETTPQGEKWKDDNQGVWDAQVGWMLNQNAIASIAVSGLTVGYVKNIGNIQMSLAVQPGTGRITVGQVYLHNETRFEPAAKSQFPRQRIGLFDPVALTGGVSDVNQHLMISPPAAPYISTATPAQRALSLNDPRSIVWKDGTSVYIAGMGSNNVIKCTSAGVRQGTINVGKGPVGLVLDAARSRLYCVNRFEGTVSVINTATELELGRVSFYDPTPGTIKVGRPVFYDAHATSQLGEASCASCHIDGKNDMQAWDLGNPAGAMKLFNQSCNAGLPVSGVCQDWNPMKGPLMTQTLQGLAGGGPMHWRGDREDIAAFSVGFTGLLGADAPPAPAQMSQLDAFLQTMRFQPQPNRTITDGLPASVPGYAGNPNNGALYFTGPGIGQPLSCVQCHSLPSGGGTTIISANVINEAQGLKTPHLRDLYRKRGFDSASQSTSRGYGYGADGSSDSVFSFLSHHIATFPAGQIGIDMRRDIEAYLMCFTTGTHPAIGTQITVDATNNSSAAVVNLLSTMQSLADSGAVGVVAKGVVGGIARGYAYLPGAGSLQSDRHAEVVSLFVLRTSGATVTFTVVPPGTQTRIGIDRDEDGYFDRDEIDAGSNPADPSSTPTCYANCDGSTTLPLLTANDFQCFLNAFASASAYANCDASTTPPVLTANDFQCFLNRYAQGCP